MSIEPNKTKFINYLLPELSKLKNKEDCENFLKKVKEKDLKRLQFPTKSEDLINQFNDSDTILIYLNSLSYYEIIPLTYMLSKMWRKNSVYNKLIGHNIWKEEHILIDDIYLENAESSVKYIFKRNDYKLTDIVYDSDLWKIEPYYKYTTDRIVEYPICLAKNLNNKYIIFDGIHRAIQMAYSNYKYITLYYYK